MGVQKRRAAGVVLVLATANLPWLVTLGLALVGFSSPGWVGAGLALVAVAAAFLSPRIPLREGAAMAFGGVLTAMVLCPLMATKVVDAVAILTDRIPTVALAEVTQTHASVVAIDDGEARMDWLAADVASRVTRKDRYEQAFDDYAAPIVAPDHARDEPVAVWLLCSVEFNRPPEQTEAACRAKMAERPIVGRTHVVDPRSSLDSPDAVTEAREQHGLSVPEEITVLELSDDLTGWARMFALIGLFAVLALNVVTIVAHRSLASDPSEGDGDGVAA